MKKALLIILIIVVLLTGAMLAIPVLFKPAILQATKNTINKEVNAKVEFSDLRISLFKDFPKVSLELTDVLVKGKNEFSGDTLLFATSVNAITNWNSVFKKSGRSVEEISILNPKVNLIVNETEKANWDLSNEKQADQPVVNMPEQAPDNNSNAFELQVDNVEIKDAIVTYTDIPAKLNLRFSGMNFSVSGKLYNTSTLLQTNGSVKDFLLNYNGVDYISHTTLETETLLEVEFEKAGILFVKNELRINRLPLELTGRIDFPSDSIFFNLLLKTKESGFDNFLALIPPVYSGYLKDVTTSGNANVTSRLGGYYYEDNYPAFVLNISVVDGNAQFKDLPGKIEKVNADIKISKPQGKIDKTEITIKKAHAEINKTPIDLTMKISDLTSDTRFDGSLVGALNFSDLRNTLPMDSANMSGSIDANLFVKGNYSSIEKEEYDKILATGIVMLNNFTYDSPTLTQRIFVPTGMMEFSPQNVFLRNLNIKVGQSDFKLTGKVANYLNYLLKDGTISGSLQLNSSFVNFNELLRLQQPEKQKQVDNNSQANQESKPAKSEQKQQAEEENLTIDIPENIDLTFTSKINKAVFDRVPVTQIDGLITMKDGKLNMNGLNMNLLEGVLSLTGSYQNTTQNQPLFDFGFNASNIDIPTASGTLTSMQNLFPVAGHSQGKLNTKFNLKGQLSSDHKIIGRSVNGYGNFSTVNLEINNSPVFNELKGILKPEKLQHVKVDDFQGNFTIENGNIDLKPFKTRVADQETTVKGTISAENLLDMRLDFIVNRDAFGTDIQNILSILPGNEKIKILPAGVLIKGPANEPEVKMDLTETRKTVADATKGELQNSLDKLGQGLKKLFQN